MSTAITAPAPSATPAATAVGADTALRRVLLLDAVVSGANGVGYLAGATVLDDVLGVSAGALRPIGAFLVVFAAAVAVIATRRPIPAAGVRELIAGNSLWVVASLAVAATGVLDPSGVGTAWIVAQAVVVAGFAAAQRRFLPDR